MMEPPESFLRNDPTGGHGANSPIRCSLPESKVRTVFVIVPDIIREQTLQMGFVQHNDVIQQVSPTAFNPTFRSPILARAFEGGSDGANLQGANRYRDFHPIFPISVKNQKPGSRPKRKRLSQLLNDPSTSRVLRDIEI
jgi:hypothetical protein